MRRALAALMLLGGAGMAQAQLPARVEILYEVLRNGSVIAEITGRVEQSAGGYRLVETWQGKGLYALLGRAKRTSLGILSATGPRPREFTDERSGRDTARAWFDWGANTLTMRYKGRSRTEPIPPNAQDRISFMLALALAPAGTRSLDVHLVDGRGVSHHIYEYAGRERVKTAAGEFDALKVLRSRDNERVQIWLAVSRGNLPVRMLAEKDGTTYDQVAVRISGF